MIPLLGLLALAWADTRDDLARAADASLTETERMAVFEQLSASYPSHHDVVLEIARDAEADARQRWVAIRLMGHSRAAVSEELLQLTRDEMPAIRVASASALGDMGAHEATDRLIAMLEDPAMICRHAAAVSLGQLKAPEAIPALASALGDDSNYYRGSSLWIRRYYVEALGAIGDRRGVPVLIDHFNDPDPQVVDASLAALRDIVGYDFAEGRTQDEHMNAWRRWWSAEQKK